MPQSIARIAAHCSIAVTVALLASAASALAAGSVSPLPESDYGTQAVCAPPPPGHASCLALQLVPETAEASAHSHPLGVARAAVLPAPTPAEGFYGLRPQDLHSAYALPSSATSAQTIAIVDSFNDPNAASDLRAYDEEFSLPACTVANGCFAQVNQSGEASNLPFPQTNAELESARSGSSAERSEATEATGWGLEISLDIETAHATCQSCHVLLVEARSSSYSDLEAAERRALALGANEISNSWGGSERGDTPEEESASAFAHPDVVITASTGDHGYLEWGAESSSERGYAEFPSSSPHVVAVGGTRLTLNGSGGWAGETVWNGHGASGGGCSVDFTAPSWQQHLPDWSAVGCGDKRAVADVAADADPYTGLAVHDTSIACAGHGHWCTMGGTSLASPLVAGVFALAGGAGGVSYPASTLYENEAHSPSSLHDVSSGSNGECVKGFSVETGLSSCTISEQAASCSSQLICLAAGGYDGPSGVGTPDGLTAFEPSGAGQSGGGGEEGGKEAGKEHSEERAGGSPEPPVGSTGGSTGGGSTGGGSASGAGTISGGAPHAPAGPSSGGPIQANITDLALTLKALIALNRSRPRSSAVSFAFYSSALTTVRATLARHVRRHGRVSWQTLSGGVTLTVLPGRNAGHLLGRTMLMRGLYRLTLAPAGAIARSVQFQIG